MVMIHYRFYVHLKFCAEITLRVFGFVFTRGAGLYFSHVVFGLRIGIALAASGEVRSILSPFYERFDVRLVLFLT